ncbi:oxidoreductase [Novosphingobium sp. FGD1]|jgi:predicted dehydrogenase|uniref:Oxidoreductase n=1 Tax=Novosphingobium silvae TaxID=2692619 RepID=A0A7X4GFY1_9SPHN|nr:oxidoreductase [Novosphingobium silvae]MYL96824.1 oxidoreductase [Novosphingobium silvae]
MKEIGVGIIGNGMATRVFHVPYIRACEQLDLKAVVSRRPQTEPPCDGIAVVSDVDTLLADPAIALVVIATPSDTHADIARKVIEAGRHVVVEKPFTLQLTQAQALVELARERGVVLSVFHNRRWDTDFMAVRAAIDEGLIGRVVHFESHFDRFRPNVRDRWREDGSPGSGVWFDLGPHLVDQVIQIFGPPSAVTADIDMLRDGSAAADWAHIVLQYPGMRAVLHAGMCVAGGEPRFRVHGIRGTLLKQKLDPQEGQSVAGLSPAHESWGLDTDPLLVIDGEGQSRSLPAPRGSQQRFYTMMAEACLGVGPPPASSAEILAVQQVIEAALVSTSERRTVDLSLQISR